MKFDTKKTYLLEDERVLLRPLQQTDIQFLLPYAINEPDTWNYSSKSVAGEEGMNTYIKEALAAKEIGKEYPYIVFDKQTGRYAGSTRFYDIQRDYQSMQLGSTWYGSDFRGTGLNKHCKFLLLQFAFETLGAERVEFRADSRNERSIAAMKSIGCKEEGILRNHMPTHTGGRRHSIILSILKDEWHTAVKEQLKSQLR